ncbi:hypothetical protein [Synechococcus sp. MIT S9508]|uniref:hypothetical protein n=1 Tax=Synechococcus sp. MIT S9508 TaxID=1801629 RepID=UPI0012E7A3B9|nr:hypothetical protein [Synechococcus sp. MIT S9508]
METASANFNGHKHWQHGAISKSKERRQMLPTFVWSIEDIDRLEFWWSNRIELLIAMKQPLAASALFDEFQLKQQSNFTHPD